MPSVNHLNILEKIEEIHEKTSSVLVLATMRNILLNPANINDINTQQTPSIRSNINSYTFLRSDIGSKPGNATVCLLVQDL